MSAYQAGRDRNFSNVRLSMETALGRSFIPQSNPYTQALADAGLGDWQDIVKTFVGEVGKGVATRIGGRAPGPTTVINQLPPPSQLPSWAVPVGLGAGGLVLFLLLRR